MRGGEREGYDVCLERDSYDSRREGLGEVTRRPVAPIMRMVGAMVGVGVWSEAVLVVLFHGSKSAVGVCM